jgi:hypothetical protein
MEDVEKLLKGTVEELDQLLNAKNVLGDPIERDGATVTVRQQPRSSRDQTANKKQCDPWNARAPPDLT